MITSFQNEKIKNLVSLQKKKARSLKNEFIIDGYKCILAALKSKINIQEVYYYNEDLDQSESEKKLLSELQKLNVPLITVSQNIFQKISYGNLKSGFIALAKAENKSILDFKKSSNKSFYVILENLEKPGNIGAILRTADSLNCSGVFVLDSKTDLYNPNIIRASLGGCFTVPYCHVTKDELKKFLHENKIRCVILTPNGKNNYLDVDYKCPVAILAGNEHFGVDASWLSSETETVYIPMNGVLDSLNVSVATTVLLFEIFRQNKNKNY